MKKISQWMLIALLAQGCGSDDEVAEDIAATSEVDTQVELDSTEENTSSADAENEGGMEEAEPCDKVDGVCDVILPDVLGPAFRISALAIGADGTEGQAMNIDPEAGDEDCQPEGKCDEGRDNALSVLGGFANDGLSDALANGNLMILGQITSEDLSGNFDILLYSGTPTNDVCDFQTENCAYDVDGSSWGCNCELRASMSGTIEDGVLIAGGDNATFNFTFPIDEDTLDLTAVRARMQADVTEGEEGLSLSNVLIGGAVRQSTLIKTIEDHPAETFGQVSKSTIITVIESILPDVDTDGDGEDDGLSIGLVGAAIPATISSFPTFE